jgi:SAM-dependent methyltransferase
MGPYTYEVMRTLVESDIRTMVDVGAGRNWFFPTAIKEKLGLILIGTDIDGEEMAFNADLDKRLVGDACQSLGVPAGSVDLITSRAGVEHFPNNAAFLRNCAFALRPGGKVILSFAGRYAPFAILNRMMPEPVSRWLLDRLLPDKTEKLGLKAYYNCCTHSAMIKAAKAAGLTPVREVWDYQSSDYFGFFVPAFLMSSLYDGLRRMIGVKDLASYYTFVFEKPAPPAGAGLLRPVEGAQPVPRVAE